MFNKINKLFLTILLGLLIPLTSLADSTHSANFVAASSQYLTHADGGVYSIQDGWTVEAWVRSFDNADDQMVFQKRVDSTDNIGGSLLATPRTLTARVDNGDGNSVNFAGDGTWHHTAIYFNGSATKIYIDGVVATNTPYTLIPAAATTTSAVFTIGSRNGVAVYFNGAIDDFRIWNDERTATEINDNKGCELVGDETGLQAYYKFNGATIDLTDSTSGANTLVNNNSVTASTSVPSIIGTCAGAAAPPPSIESDFIIFSLLWLRDDGVYVLNNGNELIRLA